MDPNVATSAHENPRQRFPFDALTVDQSAEVPLYRQLEDQIRGAIWEARLRPGERLPASRQLARDLDIARNTVKAAYNQLIAEGYLVTSAGSGTRVAPDLPEHLLQVPVPEQRDDTHARSAALSATAKRIASFSPWIDGDMERPSRPFRPHTPATDAFPRRLWATLTTRRLRQMGRSTLERVDPRGYHPLREAIAGYLGSARGVSCSADQVIVTAGTQQAIELIAKIFIEPGDKVCMEDPGYAPARIVFELAGADVVSIPVDNDGLETDFLERKVTSAKLVYVTPSSQFPLGTTMSLARRLNLIEWAERSGAVILEDDYNGEYRYAGRPLPALYGLASPGRVLYTGSFSKLLFPALRIGYVVVPEDTVRHFAAARWLIDRHSPPLEQAVLADFIDEGHFARHVRRMRTLYAERQRALVDAAEQDWAGMIDVPALDSGLHLIGWLCGDVTEDRILKAARSAGIDLTPTSWFGVRKPQRQSVILGYAPFTPRLLRRATGDLAQALTRDV